MADHIYDAYTLLMNDYRSTRSRKISARPQYGIGDRVSMVGSHPFLHCVHVLAVARTITTVILTVVVYCTYTTVNGAEGQKEVAATAPPWSIDTRETDERADESEYSRIVTVCSCHPAAAAATRPDSNYRGPRASSRGRRHEVNERRVTMITRMRTVVDSTTAVTDTWLGLAITCHEPHALGTLSTCSSTRRISRYSSDVVF
jgi:hypothetical protein